MNLRKIKTTILSICVLSASLLAQEDKETLLTVGNLPVSVGEFKYIYEKNNGKDANYSKASIAEYLDLYTRFKLKVNEAKAQKIDTIPSLKEELNGYKRQLANSYLMDKGVKDYLLEDLKRKIVYDVKIAHIYIPIPNFATDSVSKSAEQRINMAHTALEKGESFENVALKYSEDNNSKNTGGEIGYYTAMMPNGFYLFENAMYNTAINKYSKPLKSKMGWHIIKVLDKREARGMIQVAHLLVRSKGNPTAKNSIYEIYNGIKSGSRWDEMVSRYSQDTETAQNQGVLPAFGINNYEKTFEDNAFNLKNTNDYSAPFETSAGWHIVRLVQKFPIIIDENFAKVNEPKIKNNERWQTARIDYLESIRQAASFSKNSALIEKFTRGLNDEFFTYKWSKTNENEDNMTLISFGNQFQSTLGDFKTFAQNNSRIRLRFDNINHKPVDAVTAVLDAYIEEKTVEFEQNNMEQKYPDFKALMREYEEGILLFEITKNEVWDKANQDTVGLKQFYEVNKQKYMSEEKALIHQIVIKNTDEKTAFNILKEASKSSIASLSKKYNKKIKVIESTESNVTKEEAQKLGLDWKKGAVNAMEKNLGINAYIFSKIEGFIAAAPKDLKDTRGYVVADFQDSLEKSWIESLRKKYPVKINENILNNIYK